MTYREKTVYNALPKLPGFNFSELHVAATHGRRQYCIFSDDGTRTVLDAPQAASAHETFTADRGCGIPVRVLLDHFPEWKTVDDKVLRFFGYYTEVVDNSTTEEWRVRKVKVHYFLADGTLTIIETPAVFNSGLDKRTTVSRFKPDGLNIFSFCVGGSFNCRGITYELVDCDASTREFCERLGMQQPEPLGYPIDAFEAQASKGPSPMDEQHIAMRRTVEQQAATRAGTQTMLLTPEERTKAREFFEHDREVLRFFATWDKRQYRVHYHLADNTIAIMFDPAANDGRDRCAVFVRRGKIPREARAVLLQTETLHRPLGTATQYITVDDLRTGTTVDIFTRPFYIYDCDEWTRSYFADRGVTMDAFPKPQTEHDLALLSKQRPRRGKDTAAADEGKQYGASTIVMSDSVVPKDHFKMTRFANDVFRFSARLVDAKPVDRMRKFVFCYYLSDDTVSVYEIPVANSGHLSGKIFTRSTVPHLNDPSKVFVGAIVSLAGLRFVLEDMDDRTRRYIEEGMPNSDDTYFHISELLSRVQQRVLQRFSRVTDAFRHYASSSVDGLTRVNVEDVFTDNGIRLTTEELDGVMERVDKDHNGLVLLASFAENFLGQQFMSDFQPRNQAQRTVPRGPINSAAAIAQRANAAEAANMALKKLLSLSEARRTLLTHAVRTAAAETYDGCLDMQELVDCFTKRLNITLSEEDMGALMYKFYYTPGFPQWAARRLTANEVQRLINL